MRGSSLLCTAARYWADRTASGSRAIYVDLERLHVVPRLPIAELPRYLHAFPYRAALCRVAVSPGGPQLHDRKSFRHGWIICSSGETAAQQNSGVVVERGPCGSQRRYTPLPATCSFWQAFLVPLSPRLHIPYKLAVSCLFSIP